ncbi:MAG TPA: ketoacyl-ACP synthase III [Bryobacteraceae bacterium]|nr:ketoacyl-ACP synthase III [Bryobacteraceae bacterium]
MRACIRSIEYHLPELVLSSARLAEDFPDWPAEKIEAKTGIRERRIAGEGECSSDLAVAAARKLFAGGACAPETIDYVLLCTQTPDYFLPTTACLVQERLGIPTSAGALDFNLGCSGYVYGLSLAQGLIETGQARHVLLLTAETYSKFIDPRDKNVRTIFGDAAAATLVEGVEDGPPRGPTWIGPFIFGTDGAGAANLRVESGGMRCRGAGSPHLHMNGPKIFEFTLRAVPQCVGELLKKSQKSAGEIDRFIFHQANEFMLDHLRKKIGVPLERFSLAMRHCGNTVSASIPIAMKEDRDAGKFLPSDLAMLVGFGVGYSWAATLVRWP